MENGSKVKMPSAFKVQGFKVSRALSGAEVQ
jgi:hypothetical protein